MISQQDVEAQLRKIGFNPRGWGRGEVRELCNVMLPGEEIAAAVNGYYEGGFALLVASKDRVLLVDKKPLNNLKFEDLRFDMISEFDYNHSMAGASVCISSGYKTLKFNSINQGGLRNLLSFVQNRMAEIKHVQHSQQEAQQQYLERMNRQLQQYLLESERRNLALQQQQRPTTGQPDYQPHTLVSTDSFNQAAAASIGAGGSAEPAEPAIQPALVDSRQIGFNAIRRVLPMIAAYGGRAFARRPKAKSESSPLPSLSASK